MSEQRKQSFEHVIRERWCKGCGVCIAFCPKQVLTLKNGKVFAEKPELCIGCRLCELRCPDYAIEIKDAAAPKAEEHDSSCVDYAVPPEANHA